MLAGKTYSSGQVLLLYDLYWLRYEKPGEQWFELTDYIRSKLRQDGFEISYDDVNKDLIFDNVYSMKGIVKEILQKKA